MIPTAVAVLLTSPDGRFVWLAPRMGPLFADHWECPAGKVEEGEQPYAAMARELLEETGVSANGSLRKVGTITYAGRVEMTLAVMPLDASVTPQRTEPDKRGSWRKFSLAQACALGSITPATAAPVHMQKYAIEGGGAP